MSNKITCTCGHSWNKSSSSKKDMNICHICGKDNTMQMGGFVYPVNYVPQKENGGWLDKFDIPEAQNGIEGTMGGLTDKGFNYNGAWGGTMQMGGAMPGSVGFTYARTKGIPSEGPYAKKTMPSAQKGTVVSDNTKIKPIVTYKPMNRESVRSTGPFTPKDNRSIFSDSRAKERINNPNTDFVQGLTVDTFIDQFPYSAIALTAKAINEGKPLTAISELVKQPLHAVGDVVMNALQENPKGIDVKTLEEKTIPFARLAANALFGNPIITEIGKQRVESGRKKGPKSYDYELPALFDAANSYGIDYNTFTQFIEDNWESSGGNYKKILDLANKKFPKKQNGGEMKFYQEGLDWKPKNISRNGSEIKKAQIGIKERAASDNTSVRQPRTDMLTMDEYRLQQALANQPVVQPALKTGQLSSEEIKRKNKAYAQQTGKKFNENTGKVSSRFSPQQGKTLDRIADNLVIPMLELEGLISGAPLLGSGVRQGLKAVGKNLVEKTALKNAEKKSIGYELRQLAANFNPKNLKTESGTDFMKSWYSDPDFARRYVPTGRYETGTMQQHILDQLKEYEPKNYIDLLKDKGVGTYLNKSATTGGVSWGTPKKIYVNRSTYAPFNKQGLESVRAHELTHLIENNGNLLSYQDESALLKPFGIEALEEVPKPSFFKKLIGDDPEYYLDPTEIHARMNQARFDLGLSPKDAFTEKMFSDVAKKKDWYGMGKYIKDKKGFVDLMNNFWAVPPAVIGATALDQQRDGGVTKDDNGYWNPENWGEPVEIGSNEITMQGVYEPLLGISDTGDTQMMYPGEDYTFDGESVTEYPVAQDGETLLKNKKVGQLETPIANLNLRPTYPNFKTKIEYVTVPDCPGGVGCSKQATMDAQKITGLPYVSYAPADAAYRDAVAKRTGLQNIFDQEGSQKTNANSRAGNNWKYPTNEDFKNWKAGDIVTLDAGNDYYFPYNAPKGYSSKDNYGQSHNGMIYGFTPEGRPIIKHGAAKGRDRGKSWTEVLGEDNRVTDLGHGRYAVKSVWRPQEVSDDGTVSSIKNVFDLGKDAAKRKQDTTSNEKFYLKNTSEERLMEDAAAAGEFSGASNRLNTKKKLVNLFNNEKLNKDLQYKFGITAEELNNLKPVVYGIFGQESNFNDVDSPAASFKEILGNMLGGNSRGAAQIKLKSLTPEERKILGVKKSSDLDSDEAAYKAALLMVSNAKKRMDKEVAQGTHPELANVDENFRAGYYYNSPARAVNSAKDWAKKSKPSQWFNPLSWKNAITTRERPDVFGGINPNYVNNAELRMDEGSYPYKLMENARDLGVGVDFEKGKDLEEVVVRGTTKPNTTFIKKKNGGWLDEL